MVRESNHDSLSTIHTSQCDEKCLKLLSLQSFPAMAGSTMAKIVPEKPATNQDFFAIKHKASPSYNSNSGDSVSKWWAETPLFWVPM